MAKLQNALKDNGLQLGLGNPPHKQMIPRNEIQDYRDDDDLSPQVFYCFKKDKSEQVAECVECWLNYV